MVRKCITLHERHNKNNFEKNASFKKIVKQYLHICVVPIGIFCTHTLSQTYANPLLPLLHYYLNKFLFEQPILRN